MNPQQTTDSRERTPLWAFAAILLLVSAEPLAHVWVAYFPPAGTVPTGLRTGDSHVYLHSMRIFETDFSSPYASCQSEWGPNSPRYFALPAHWVYGALGYAATAVGLDHFLALGLFNGLFGFLYLWAVYRLMSAAVPRLARVAFPLFLLGGSPSGLLFFVTGAMGLHHAPEFDAYFYRYAVYDLMEGQHLWPITLMPRLYYTLSLASSLAAFTCVIRYVTSGRVLLLILGALLMLAGQIVNMRVGTFTFAVLSIYLFCCVDWPFRRRIAAGLVLFVPMALGAGLTILATGYHPVYSQNHFTAAREAMWFSPFICGTVLFLFFVPRVVLRSIVVLPRSFATLATGLVGYLSAFTVLYAGYLVYYGEYVRPNDVMSAITISDWALIGFAPGMLYGLLRKSSTDWNSSVDRNLGWVGLWLLVFVTLAISAWGQGWYMRLLPRRTMVLIGLPLALLAADGWLSLHARHRRWAQAWAGVFAVFGLCTVAVATIFFQGPLGHEPGKGPYPEIHYELMTQADAQVLDTLPPGRVLVPMYNPWCFSEVIALRPGMSVAMGVGTITHSDLAFGEMKERIAQFFAPGTSAESRKAFVQAWCVDTVYCPDTCPVPPEVIAEFETLDWLEEIGRQDGAVAFKVTRR